MNSFNSQITSLIRDLSRSSENKENRIINMKNPKCCICGCECESKYGNNAQPLKEGICCDVCNMTKVIPLRFGFIQSKGKSKKTKTK